MSFLKCTAQKWTLFYVYSMSEWCRINRITAYLEVGNKHLLMQSMIAFACFSAASHYWLMFNFWSTKTIRSFFFRYSCPVWTLLFFADVSGLSTQMKLYLHFWGVLPIVPWSGYWINILFYICYSLFFASFANLITVLSNFSFNSFINGLHSTGLHTVLLFLFK